MKTMVTGLTAILALSACAKQPEDIRPQEVSAANYQFLSCEEMAVEAKRINASLEGAEDDRRTGAFVDNFFGAGGLLPMSRVLDDSVRRVGSLKGQQIAIREAWDARNCQV